MIKNNWRSAILTPGSTIEQAINNLNKTGLQIVVVIDENDILLGTITDGDIRRGLLRGIGLNATVENIMQKNSIVVKEEASREEVMNLMHENRLHQLPVINCNNKIINVYFWDEVILPPIRENIIVIMAGGMGIRLRPYTEQCPKPMLHVSGKPILEHIILRAKSEGFINFIISIQYLGEVIENYFKQGNELGVNIDYIRETQPLGTAGSLGLFKKQPEIPFIVTNGDLLSDIKYSNLLDFHIHHAADATMAVRNHEWQNPFGVVITEGIKINNFDEKPIIRSQINAGIYVLNPEVLNYISKGNYCDMPMVFKKMQHLNKNIVAYSMNESWLDVGRPDDLQQARDAHQEGER